MQVARAVVLCALLKCSSIVTAELELITLLLLEASLH